MSTIGIHSKIIETPGHSPDGISRLLDSGDAFIGDLGSPELVDPSGAEVVASWQTLLEKGAWIYYHSHSLSPPSASTISSRTRKNILKTRGQ